MKTKRRESKPIRAPKSITNRLITVAHRFLLALEEADYDDIWDHMITERSVRLLSTAIFPVRIYHDGQIDKLLTRNIEIDPAIPLDEAMSLAFQMDLNGLRSSFFDGIAHRMGGTGWYDFYEKGCEAFVSKNSAVLVADTPKVTMIMLFSGIRGEEPRVDLEAMTVFSLSVSARDLHDIGKRAHDLGESSSALAYFELASSLKRPHSLLKLLVWDHLLVKRLITDQRRNELRVDSGFVNLAQERVDQLLDESESQDVFTSLRMVALMQQVFRGYQVVAETELTPSELNKLHGMNDEEIRRSLASLMRGVDPVLAQREAEKPHTPAEIADMEVPIVLGGREIYLCLVVKSGLEIRSRSVPVDIAYQILRPFTILRDVVVVFITAKPCSQPLLNYIKQAQSTLGLQIGVIQDDELGRLLKANQVL